MKSWLQNQRGTYGIFNSKGKLVETCRTKGAAEVRKRKFEKMSLNMEDFKIKKLKNLLGIKI